MKQVKVLIQIPATVKQQLDALRSQGYTINGYIRSLIERDLKKGR
jgi:mannitol/fructose-specific phosphotransferase system IIA component